MKKLTELYRGKSKTIYSTDNPCLLVMEFRDDISAENGKRMEQFKNKGKINNRFNYFIMKKLQEEGILTHVEYILSDTEIVVKKLNMFPIEYVIRNYSAGSLVKRLSIKEGVLLNPPLFDLFLKDDLKNDPIINESYCETFGFINKEYLAQIQNLTYKINNILSILFDKADIILADFKLEFGLFNGKILLGDEFSPDVARLWDKNTMHKMDKDRFRQKLDCVIENYERVSLRLGIKIN